MAELASLVFDFDGLILDTESTDFTATAETLATVGVSYTMEECHRQVGTVFDWLAWAESQLARPFSLSERTELRHLRRARNLALIAAQQIRPGVTALLAEAAARQVPCAVASSSPSTWVEGHLDMLGLRTMFAAVLCVDHVERAKPAPDLYLAATAALSVSAARCVALEDSHHGTTAAKAAALTCVVCPGPITAEQDHSRADLVVASLADLTWSMLEQLLPR